MHGLQVSLQRSSVKLLAISDGCLDCSHNAGEHLYIICLCNVHVGALRLKELAVHLSDTKRQFENTHSYFCVEAPCGEGRVSPAHFFGLWSPFLREFQGLWSIEMKNRAMAR